MTSSLISAGRCFHNITAAVILIINMHKLFYLYYQISFYTSRLQRDQILRTLHDTPQTTYRTLTMPNTFRIKFNVPPTNLSCLRGSQLEEESAERSLLCRAMVVEFWQVTTYPCISTHTSWWTADRALVTEGCIYFCCDNSTNLSYQLEFPPRQDWHCF